MLFRENIDISLFAKLTVLVTLLFFPHAIVFAEPIFLKVAIKNQKATDYYPACESEKCVPWSFWYVFDAKVINVLDGEYNKDEVRFAHLQHAAWNELVLKEMYIVVDKFTNNETSNKVDSKFYALYMGTPKKIVCIPPKILNKLPSNSKYEEKSFYSSCFETDDLVEMGIDNDEVDK